MEQNPPCVRRVGRSNGKGHLTTPVRRPPSKSGRSCDCALKTRVYAVDLMFGRFRVLVSVSAAFPISPTDGEVVYNFRGTLDTANFLGQLFRTFSEVLNLGNRQSGTAGKSFKTFTHLK